MGGSRPPGRPGDVRRPREARGRRGGRDRVPPGRLRREDALGLGPDAPTARARRPAARRRNRRRHHRAAEGLRRPRGGAPPAPAHRLPRPAHRPAQQGLLPGAAGRGARPLRRKEVRGRRPLHRPGQLQADQRQLRPRGRRRALPRRRGTPSARDANRRRGRPTGRRRVPRPPRRHRAERQRGRPRVRPQGRRGRRAEDPPHAAGSLRRLRRGDLRQRLDRRQPLPRRRAGLGDPPEARGHRDVPREGRGPRLPCPLCARPRRRAHAAFDGRAPAHGDRARRRPRPPLPAARPPGLRRDHRRRGAHPLAGRRTSGAAGRFPPARRANGAHGASLGLGDRRGVPTGEAMARPQARPLRLDQPAALVLAADRDAPRARHDRVLRAQPRPAHDRDHRVGDDGRSADEHGFGHRRAARARASPRDRRLRERPLLPLAPEPDARLHAEDRPLLRERPSGRPQLRGARLLDHPALPEPRPRAARRGHRDGGAARLLPRARLRARPGLPLQPAGQGKRARDPLPRLTSGGRRTCDLATSRPEAKAADYPRRPCGRFFRARFPGKGEGRGTRIRELLRPRRGPARREPRRP